MTEEVDDTVSRGKWVRQYHKAMALKEHLQLDDDERYELAMLLPSVEDDFDGSWRSLDSDQLHDLITMMEGYVFINFLYSQDFPQGD